MPDSTPSRPRHRFPAPMTTAVWTPRPATSRMMAATSKARFGSIPKPCVPARASPPSLSRTRLNTASPIISLPGKTSGQPVGWPARSLDRLAHLPAGKTPDGHVFSGGGDNLMQQILDRFRFVPDIGLAEQADLGVELLQAVGDDLVNHRLGLPVCPGGPPGVVGFFLDPLCRYVIGRHPTGRGGGHL